MSLITTIAEFKSYISIDGNAKMATMQKFVDEAELIIKELLGDAFYAEYLPLYTASVAPVPTPLSADNAALLPYIQRPLAFYAQLLSIDQLSVTTGEIGIRVHRAEQSDPAPRWQVEKLQFAAMKSADTNADKLLEYMEANAAKYPTWAASSANTKKSGLLVYSTAIASEHIQISNSRRVYLQLYNTIRDLETRVIPKLIGQAQYDELVALIQAGTALSTEQEHLTRRLEAVISKHALYIQLPFMRVQVRDGGVFTYSGLDELTRFFATDADVKILRLQLMDGELGYLADERELQQFIEDNISDYPLIEASTVYTVQPDPGPTFVPKNSCDNKHFIA